jgi:protease-4
MIEILSVKAWALESRFFNRLAPAVLGWMSGGRDISALISKADTPKIEAGKTYQVNQDLFFSNEDGYFFQDEEDQIIPRTSLKGVVTKEGGLCSIGTRQLGQMMQLNDRKKNVSAHLIEIDSPGGAVDGTPELCNIIAGLDKPVIAYVDNMAASAAYWIASQADHIITNSQNYTEVGSIGTLAVLANEKEYLKKQGMKVEIIRATKSVDKARLNSIEDWPEESMAELQQDLDRYTKIVLSQMEHGLINGLTANRMLMNDVVPAEHHEKYLLTTNIRFTDEALPGMTGIQNGKQE